MMTIDEAIKHCNEVACKHNKCAMEHKQLAKWLNELKELKKSEPKFKVGDKIRRKTPSSFDTDMQVARINKDYYICNHIGKFSSEVVPFSEESSYELIEQNPAAWLEKKGEQKISFSLPTEGEFPYNNPADTLDGEIENIWEKLSCDNKFTANKDGFHEVVVHFVNWYEKQGENKPANKVEPKFRVKYADSEYNVLEVKDIDGVTFYGIEDEPNHIDYVQAKNCARVDKIEKKPAWSE